MPARRVFAETARELAARASRACQVFKEQRARVRRAIGWGCWNRTSVGGFRDHLSTIESPVRPVGVEPTLVGVRDRCAATTLRARLPVGSGRFERAISSIKSRAIYR